MTLALRKRILLVDDDPVGAELTLAALAMRNFTTRLAGI